MLFQKKEGQLLISNQQAQAHRNQPLLCFLNESEYCYPDQESFYNQIFNTKFLLLLQTTTELHLKKDKIKYSQQQTIVNNPITFAVPKKSSIFHNFQKHLCSFLNRTVIIKENETKTSQQNKCAIALWDNFFKKRTYTKKKLYSIFGIDTSKKKITPNRANFCRKGMPDKQSSEVVDRAKRILRQSVITQCRDISKQYFLSHSQARHSQQFFSYFKLFLDDLVQYQNFKPMTKARLKTAVSQTAHLES